MVVSFPRTFPSSSGIGGSTLTIIGAGDLKWRSASFEFETRGCRLKARAALVGDPLRFLFLAIL